MKHELKIWPQYFERFKDRTKTFEVRVNDRGFQSEDTVVLEEWDPTRVSQSELNLPPEYKEPAGYTGISLMFKIGYVLPVDSKRVVFQLASS